MPVLKNKIKPIFGWVEEKENGLGEIVPGSVLDGSEIVRFYHRVLIGDLPKWMEEGNRRQAVG